MALVAGVGCGLSVWPPLQCHRGSLVSLGAELNTGFYTHTHTHRHTHTHTCVHRRTQSLPGWGIPKAPPRAGCLRGPGPSLPATSPTVCLGFHLWWKRPPGGSACSGLLTTPRASREEASPGVPVTRARISSCYRQHCQGQKPPPRRKAGAVTCHRCVTAVSWPPAPAGRDLPGQVTDVPSWLSAPGQVTPGLGCTGEDAEPLRCCSAIPGPSDAALARKQ